MRVLLDANILFPTVMREVLLGAAEGGAFTPLWSERILEEWAHAARRLSFAAEAIARAEVAVMHDRWPQASVSGGAVSENDVFLPDRNDRHVLAAAINGQAHTLLTRNLKDFPTRVLSSHGIIRREPDGFLMEIHQENETLMREVTTEVRSRAEAVSGREQPLRTLLKRAGLPRLGKALAAPV